MILWKDAARPTVLTLILLTGALLALSVAQAPGASRGPAADTLTLAVLSLPWVLAITLPLAVLLGFGLAGRRAGRENARIGWSRGTGWIVALACLAEGALLFGAMAPANSLLVEQMRVAHSGDLGDPTAGVREMGVAELLAVSPESRLARIEIQKRASFVVSVAGLALLGTLIGRRLTSRPFLGAAIAALAGSAWLLVATAGETWASQGAAPVWVGAWLPTLLIAAIVGSGLLRTGTMLRPGS